MKKTVFSLLIFLLLSSLSFSEDMSQSELKVNRFTLSTAVENREPIDTKDSFLQNERAWLFTEILNGSEGRSIYHVWNFHQDGKVFEMARIKLNVNGNRWRTWSNKNLFKKGLWSIEVSDEYGNILASKEFNVLKEIIEDVE